MKKTSLFLFLILSSFAHYAFAGGGLDVSKGKIDARAKVDLGKIKTEVGVRYDITKNKFEILYGKFGMSAGDIVIAAEISKKTGRDIDDVCEKYKSHKGNGWGNLAKQLGIKPGSAEFHQLKSDVDNFAYAVGASSSPSGSKGKKGKKHHHKKNNP